MKSVFIVYNQAHTEQVEMVLDRLKIQGFTRWDEVQGRGSNEGEAHYGSHAWPAKNHASLVVVEDEKVSHLLHALKILDDSAPLQGLRAFVWNVEQMI